MRWNFSLTVKGVVMIIIGKVSEETKGINYPMWVEGGQFPYSM
jgi:hypothetical protein